ncbi:sugar ABC transporter substrate-binding protein [Kineococcus gypseus]|uniref:sugar ABC transporter substrate-binding protein n=1 Tax=Kineococcus gypseus TaxID=1637102 RepID=UPI003D7F13B1
MSTRKSTALALATALALVLAGCGTGGRAQDDAPEQGAPAGGERRDLSFAVVVHSNPDGSFWNVVKRGAEDAGLQFGVEVTVTGDPEGSRQGTLVQSALADDPDGLVVSTANPDALRPALQQAVEQGVPFVTINSGAERSAELGAIGHVGQTEVVAGRGAGERLREAGVTHLLCLVHEAGNVGLEQRCQGIAETAGGEVENLQVDLNDPASIEANVNGALLGDPTVDGVIGLNPSVTTAALAAVESSGADVQVASFDIDQDVLGAIRDGRVLFTVDQQQYLQGYLPIAALVLNHDNLNTVGGGLPVLTGPSFITRENVDAVSDLVQRGTR